MVVDSLNDPRRVNPPTVEPDEKASYDTWLDFHRVTLLLKCEGLDDAGRRACPIPTSKMNLHGMVRHMADVERGWFRKVIAGEELDHIYDYSVNLDQDWDVPADASWDDDLATWQAEVDACRAVAAAYDLDHVGHHRRTGSSFDLRWVYVHMIEEYARHNGHADLIRELVDGAVGD